MYLISDGIKRTGIEVDIININAVYDETANRIILYNVIPIKLQVFPCEFRFEAIFNFVRFHKFAFSRSSSVTELVRHGPTTRGARTISSYRSITRRFLSTNRSRPGKRIAGRDDFQNRINLRRRRREGGFINRARCRRDFIVWREKTRTRQQVVYKPRTRFFSHLNSAFVLGYK